MSAGLVVALVGLTSLAIAVLLVPLLIRERRAESREAYNLAVYRDQLAEVERDIARGVLSAEQAEAARAEIGRRILALRPETARSGPAAQPLAVVAVAVLLLPVAAWMLYWRLGAPSLPDQPFAERQASPESAVAGNAPHIGMDEAIGKLQARLKEHPEDLTGWLLLGRTEVSLGKYAEAAEAYRHAVDLSGRRADILGDWGEAQMMAAGGTVTREARQAFEAGLHDPETAPRSRYYLALAQMQQGDAQGALKAWTALQADSPADAEWLPVVRARINEAAKSLGIDPSTLPQPAPRAADNSAVQNSGPRNSGAPNEAAVAAAAKAAAGAPPEERQAMIRTMVDRLVARLEQQPDDAEGWARLGRSYLVLNEPAKAREAYARAVKLNPADPAVKQGFAEAMIGAAGDTAAAPPAEAVDLFRQVLTADPKNAEALWYVGIAEAEAGRDKAASELLSRLLAELPPSAPQRAEVEKRLAALKAAAK